MSEEESEGLVFAIGGGGFVEECGDEVALGCGAFTSGAVDAEDVEG